MIQKQERSEEVENVSMDQSFEEFPTKGAETWNDELTEMWMKAT